MSVGQGAAEPDESEGMEAAYKSGILRVIGVSNFYTGRLIDLCKFVEVTPAVYLVETQVFQQQTEAHEIMQKYNVQHDSGDLSRKGARIL